jgi:hypothetical protein
MNIIPANSTKLIKEEEIKLDENKKKVQNTKSQINQLQIERIIGMS